jgi:hypothetical protein
MLVRPGPSVRAGRAGPRIEVEDVMDIAAFYAVVAGVNFTLLGLWWVAVHERVDLRDRASRRMAYVVALQFMVPGTASLVSQVAPDVTAIWRATFTLAGLAGAAGALLVLPALRRATSRTAAVLMVAVGLPLYLAVTLVAAVPGVHEVVSDQLTGLQTEAIMFSVLVLLSVQVAWTVAMTPADPPEDD